MTSKIYKSARGKLVDLGALMLENEHVRAVGNMNVNARGDFLDSHNRVIEPKAKRVQRQYKRQANVAEPTQVSGSTRSARRSVKEKESQQEIHVEEDFNLDMSDGEVEQPTDQEVVPVEPSPAPQQESRQIPRGGLAAAIARSREVKQEKLKTPRQIAQQQAGVKKI